MDIDKFLEDAREAILDHGFTVHYSDAPSKIYANLPRAYTVGRTMWGRPELLIVGPFTGEQMSDMLGEAVTHDSGTPLHPEAELELGDRKFKAIEAEPATFISAMAIFGAIRGLQLTWADPKTGKMPGEPQVVRPPNTNPLPLQYDPYDEFFEEDTQ